MAFNETCTQFYAQIKLVVVKFSHLDPVDPSHVHCVDVIGGYEFIDFGS